MSYVQTVSVRLSVTCLGLHSKITDIICSADYLWASGAAALGGRDEYAGKWAT